MEIKEKKMIYARIFYRGYEIAPFQYRYGYVIRKSGENVLMVDDLGRAIKFIDLVVYLQNEYK